MRCSGELGRGCIDNNATPQQHNRSLISGAARTLLCKQELASYEIRYRDEQYACLTFT